MRGAWLIALGVLVGCAGDDGESMGDGSADAGEQVTCPQQCLDNGTSNAAISLLTFLYNQNFAGQPVGEQNLSAACALGGSAEITGTNSYDSATGVLGIDLVYSLAGCMVADSGYTLSFDGAISQSGTTEQGGQISMVYNSASLTFQGAVEEENASGSACELALQENRNSDGSAYRVNGLLCGRSVSY